MERNIALLEKLYRFMETYPERVDMDIWGLRKPLFADVSCGTTACAAGWTALLTDAEIIWTEWGDMDKVITSDDAWLNPGDYAQEALGLTSDEANYLFHDTNNDTVLAVLKRLIAGEDILHFDR